LSLKSELADPAAPRAVRAWIADPPLWIEVREAPGSSVEEEGLDRLDPGENAAIKLATSLGGDLLLMDDRQGVLDARRKGFGVIGTIGILDLAADRSLVDLPAAVSRLRRTNFRRSESMLDALLEKHARGGGGATITAQSGYDYTQALVEGTPEPGTLGMVLVGLAALAFLLRKRPIL